MHHTAAHDDRQPYRISLLQTLDGEWIKLPLVILKDVGPAVQTLGGLLKVTNRETFTAVETIAGKARLPVATVRKHLLTLHNHGWIDHKGRQQSRRGYPRRTATIAITKQTKQGLEPWGFLPWWACCSIGKIGRLPWCSQAVLSVIMARLCSLKAVAKDQLDIDFTDDGSDDIEAEPDSPDFEAEAQRCALAAAENILAELENYIGDMEERFRFSLDWLAEQTGLSRDSIIRAKRLLHTWGVVNWTGDHQFDKRGHPIKLGRATHTDVLMPSWAFRVVVTPADPGRCTLAFYPGSKSGQ
jgi:hypothetical protein